MAINVGKLWVMIGGNAGGLQTSLTVAQRSIAQFQGSVASVASKIALLTGGMSAGGLGLWAVKLGADLERTAIQFRVLVGDAGRADQLLRDLREYALTTPFDLPGLSQASSTMLQFGVSVETIMPILRTFGDITGGDSERLGRLALVFGQMTAAGRLMGQDLLQMINAGFNPLQQIAMRTGETMQELKARMEAGGISSQEVTQAFMSATQAGGRFHGMMSAVADTTAGRFDILRGRVTELATSIGGALLPAASRLVDMLSGLVSWISNLDGKVALQIAKMATWAATTVVMISVGVRIVDMIAKIVVALRTMNVAQAITLALSGPSGWIKLAAGLAIAAGAAVLVTEMFADMEDALAKGGEEANNTAAKAKQAVDAVGSAGAGMSVVSAKSAEAMAEQAKRAEAIAAAAKQMDELAKRGQAITESMRTPQEVFADTVSELRELLAVGAITRETFDRAFAKANQDLQEANGGVKEMQANLRGLGAALDGTLEGFRATAEATRNTIELQRRQNAAQNQQQGIQQAARVTWEAKDLSEQQKRTNAILTRIDGVLNRIDANTKADAITFDVGELY